jgi:hypothetical protein
MNEELTVGYHQQDTNYYCGAACAQMVLHSVGQPLLSQDVLYNDNHSHTIEPSSWSTPPDGLQWTMNNLQSSKYFALDSLDTEDGASRMLCWTIHFWQVAPIALVEDGNHWVAVHGYTASAAPTSWDDLSYTISSFDIKDPWPPAPTPPPPPPHSDGDSCGSGGARGVANVNVSYASWQSDYMTANTFGTQWLGKYVAVCDPHRPPADGERPLPELRLNTGREALLTAAEATDAAWRGITDVGLLDRPVWAGAFNGTEAGEPILVQRLDRRDSYYWIVPASDREGLIRAAISVDAIYGTYKSAATLNAEQSVLFGFHDREEIFAHISGRPIDLPHYAGRLIFRPEVACLHPVYVWKPCRESLSPFYPFRMLSTGENLIYVRIFDGAVFTSLTNPAGGI